MVVSALQKQGRLIQTKVHFKFCYSVWIKTTHKPSKAAAKSFFSSVFVMDATCFDEYFLFHVITGKHYFLQKFVATLRAYCCVIWNKCFERSLYFTLYLYSSVLIPTFQVKLSYTKFILDKLSSRTYFMITFFIYSLLDFLAVPHFSL